MLGDFTVKKPFLIALALIGVIMTSACDSTSDDTFLNTHIPSSEKDNSSVVSENVIITMPKWSIPGNDFICVDGGKGINELFDEAVEDFNSADNGYQIVFKDYSEYYDSSKDGAGGPSMQSYSKIDFQLSMDLINGEQLDIIPQSVFADNGKFNSLVEKGAFINLYSYMENDPEVNLDSLNEHVLKICEVNGNLYYMPLAFNIETLAGYTKYVGAKENWSMYDLKLAWQKMPSNSTFNGHTTKDFVYMTLLRGELSSFIDYTKGTCNFDSPEFIDILNFCNSFPAPTQYKVDNDWDAPTFLFPFRVDNFDEFHTQLWNECNDEITLVGYPSDNESGSFITPVGVYAINAKSSPEAQEGAWQFLKTLTSYDVQYSMGEYCFPINNNAFHDRGNEEMKRKENKVSFQGDEEIDLGTLTPTEYERLTTFIDNVQKINNSIDDEVFTIIEEELWGMFDNIKTPEETAKAIQSRIELLVGEIY